MTLIRHLNLSNFNLLPQVETCRTIASISIGKEDVARWINHLKGSLDLICAAQQVVRRDKIHMWSALWCRSLWLHYLMQRAISLPLSLFQHPDGDCIVVVNIRIQYTISSDQYLACAHLSSAKSLASITLNKLAEEESWVELSWIEFGIGGDCGSISNRNSSNSMLLYVPIQLSSPPEGGIVQLFELKLEFEFEEQQVVGQLHCC